MSAQNPKDLGLSYGQALHGVQSAIKFQQEHGFSASTEPKHLRVGVDMGKSDQAALVRLLMAKGLFTLSEYLEAVRLEANEELNRFEEETRRLVGDERISFR